MALETEPWDPAVRLSAPEAQAAYLEAAFEDGDPDLIVAAIGDVARARGMSSSPVPHPSAAKRCTKRSGRAAIRRSRPLPV